MSKKKTIAVITGIAVGTTVITAHIMKKKAKSTTYKAENIDSVPVRKRGFYEKYIKRVCDVICATGAIVCFSPLYIGVAVLVKLKLGSPVLFTQDRPGLVDKDGKETIFKMYKFRTMTDERDENGDLLPDEVRLTKFGKWLRNTSLDELPEAFNILNGTMSVIGPRPQLVRDMVFMTSEQRMRHTAKPGLSGLKLRINNTKVRIQEGNIFELLDKKPEDRKGEISIIAVNDYYDTFTGYQLSESADF